jgi:hypothetical protein
VAREFLIWATDPLAEGGVAGVGVWIDQGRALLWWAPVEGETEAAAKRVPASAQRAIDPLRLDDAWYEFREALASLGEGRERWGDDGAGVDSFKMNPGWQAFAEEKQRVLTRIEHFARKWREKREKAK